MKLFLVTALLFAGVFANGARFPYTREAIKNQLDIISGIENVCEAHDTEPEVLNLNLHYIKGLLMAETQNLSEETSKPAFDYMEKAIAEVKKVQSDCRNFKDYSPSVLLMEMYLHHVDTELVLLINE